MAARNYIVLHGQPLFLLRVHYCNISSLHEVLLYCKGEYPALIGPDHKRLASRHIQLLKQGLLYNQYSVLLGTMVFWYSYISILGESLHSVLAEVTTHFPHHCHCKMLQKWRLWQSLQNRKLDLKYLNKLTNLMANYIVPIASYINTDIHNMTKIS